MQNYRNGIVNTEEHPILRKGQIVQVLFEREGYYVVRAYATCPEQKIKKEEISFG